MEEPHHVRPLDGVHSYHHVTQSHTRGDGLADEPHAVEQQCVGRLAACGVAILLHRGVLSAGDPLHGRSIASEISLSALRLPSEDTVLNSNGRSPSRGV